MMPWRGALTMHGRFPDVHGGTRAAQLRFRRFRHAPIRSKPREGVPGTRRGLRFGTRVQVAPSTHLGNVALRPRFSKERITTMSLKKFLRRTRRFAKENKAVSALEYAILVGVVAVGIAAAVATFTDEIEAAIETIGDQIAEIDTGDVDTDGDE